MHDIAKQFHFTMIEQNVWAIVFHYKAATGLFPNSQCLTTSCYYEDLIHLFSLHKVGHLSIIICSSHIESSAGSLRAEAGEDAGLGLFVTRIDGPDLHTATHQPQQPVITVYAIMFQMQVQRLVPIDS